MRYLLLILALASTSVAEEGAQSSIYKYIAPEKMKQIQEVKTKRQQELTNDYQKALKAAPTAASRTEVMNKFGKLLQPDSATISKTLPPEQYYKLREKGFESDAARLEKIQDKKGPATVHDFTSEAVRDKAVEEFKDDNGRLMRKFIGAQGNELNQRAGKEEKARVQWGSTSTQSPASTSPNYNLVGPSTSTGPTKNNQ